MIVFLALLVETRAVETHFKKLATINDNYANDSGHNNDAYSEHN